MKGMRLILKRIKMNAGPGKGGGREKGGVHEYKYKHCTQGVGFDL